MAISPHPRRERHTGNDTARAFPFHFKVFKPEELLVVHTPTSGAEHPLVLGVEYEVKLADESSGKTGGSVMLRQPLPQGDHLTLTSQVPFDQPMVFTAQTTLRPKLLEVALDRVTIQIQQLNEAIQSKGAMDPHTWQTMMQTRLDALKAELTQTIATPSVVPLTPVQAVLEKVILALLDLLSDTVDEGLLKLNDTVDRGKTALEAEREVQREQLKASVQAIPQEVLTSIQQEMEAQKVSIQEALTQHQTALSERLEIQADNRINEMKEEKIAFGTEAKALRSQLETQVTEIETRLDQDIAEAMQNLATTLTSGESV